MSRQPKTLHHSPNDATDDDAPPAAVRDRGPLGVEPREDGTETLLRELGPAHHPIRSEQIHPNVLFVCHRLQEHGYPTMVVGGAVRDLLLQRAPKDFDLATSAHPERIKDLFRNARVIGRRFPIAELRFPNMRLEVATFRAELRGTKGGMITRDTRYGSVGEDMLRRDFTINALTLDPLSLTLLDHVHALDDLEAGLIRTIKPPRDSFIEDPVRMLRAIRFQVRLGFQLDPHCEQAMLHQSDLLGGVKRHRLADELQRFLTHGDALRCLEQFKHLALLRPLLNLDDHSWFFAPQSVREPLSALRPLLTQLDHWRAQGGEDIAPTVALLALLLTLTTDGMRAALLGVGGKPKRPPAAGRVRGLLADWGLLNGQVTPALHILDAARLLLSKQGKSGDSPGKLPTGPDAPPGTREAWLLLAALQTVLDVDNAYLEQGIATLGQLQDLPILDHPRPENRLRGGRPNPRHHRGADRGRSGRGRRPGMPARPAQERR